MKYSHLFGKTIRETPKDAQITSHKLLYQAGFIRESTAGRYYILPLGWRVHEKIRSIIKEEMDKSGAQEMITPVLHPLSLWQETNRTESASFELTTVTDSRKSTFVLGGTAEEMFVELARRFKLSYRELPFNLYQFSTKFRDEKRPRGGLLRVREFVMKDAYSFDKDEKEFKKEYKKMAITYKTIFDRMGIDTIQVEADNGYIGGDYCHEFVMDSPVGESRFFYTKDNTYAAHEDVAHFTKEKKNISDPPKPYKEVQAVRGNTMEDGVVFHKLPLWQQIKDFMVVNEKGKLILAVIRGDFDINEVKLKHISGSFSLRHATEDEIRSVGSEPGFISPVGLKGKATIIGDDSLRTIRNAYCGANKKHLDAININIDRDYTLDIEGDFAMAKSNYLGPDGKKVLMEKRGIEVGNIFQLGYHYSSRMKGATFIDKDGKEKPYYMGCYGIGIGRTMAAIVEKFHDDKGIIWPDIVAPYTVHLISLQGAEKQAEFVYRSLISKGIEVLWDDREESAGVKFADCDLIGIPYRVVVSAKTGEKIEVKKRNENSGATISLKEFWPKLSI